MSARARAKKREATLLAAPAEEPSGQLVFLAPVKLPGRFPRHRALDRELRARAKRLSADFMVTLRLCDELVQRRHYERLGFQTPGDYFEARRFPFSWPTMRRYLGILEGVRRLPEAEREPALKALQGLGASKAVAIAPILGAPDEPWAKWVKAAGTLGEEDLRATVKQALRDVQTGTASTVPATKTPDQRWLDHTLTVVGAFAPEAADEIKEAFDAGKLLLRTNTYFGVLLAMVKSTISEWRLEAQEMEKRGFAAPVAAENPQLSADAPSRRSGM